MGSLLRLASGIDGVNRVIGRFVQWLTVIMVVVGAFNALGRYASRYTPVTLTSNALIDLQWQLFSLVFLLGAAYALNRDVHVRVDVLYSRLSQRGRAWIDIAGTVLFLLPFCVLMLWMSWPAVRNSWGIREGSPDPGGLPRYPIKGAILLAFVLLFLQGVSQLIKLANAIRTGEPVRGAAGGLGMEKLEKGRRGGDGDGGASGSGDGEG